MSVSFPAPPFSVSAPAKPVMESLPAVVALHPGGAFGKAVDIEIEEGAGDGERHKLHPVAVQIEHQRRRRRIEPAEGVEPARPPAAAFATALATAAFATCAGRPTVRRSFPFGWRVWHPVGVRKSNSRIRLRIDHQSSTFPSLVDKTFYIGR